MFKIRRHLVQFVQRERSALVGLIVVLHVKQANTAQLAPEFAKTAKVVRSVELLPSHAWNAQLVHLVALLRQNAKPVHLVHAARQVLKSVKLVMPGSL